MAINIPFILFELKSKFLITKNILNYLAHTKHFILPESSIYNFVTGYLGELHVTFASSPPVFAYTILISLVALAIRDKIKLDNHQASIVILLFWPFVHIFLFKEESILLQFYTGTSCAFIIFVATIFDKLHKTRKYLAPALAICLTLSLARFVPHALNTRQFIFYHQVQNEMTISDQKALVSYVLAQDMTPEWDAFTIPYYETHAYRYLFDYIRRTAPTMSKTSNSNKYYTIIEPATRGYWLDKWIAEKNAFSRIESSKSFGSLTLQTRTKFR